MSSNTERDIIFSLVGGVSFSRVQAVIFGGGKASVHYSSGLRCQPIVPLSVCQSPKKAKMFLSRKL